MRNRGQSSFFENSAQLPSAETAVELPVPEMNSRLPSIRNSNQGYMSAEFAVEQPQQGRLQSDSGLDLELDIQLPTAVQHSTGESHSPFLSAHGDSGGGRRTARATNSSSFPSQVGNTPSRTNSQLNGQRHDVNGIEKTFEASGVNPTTSNSSSGLVNDRHRTQSSISTPRRHSDGVTSVKTHKMDNMTQSNSTTPSQRYHALRRSPLRRLENRLPRYESLGSYLGEISDEGTTLSEMRSSESISQLGGGSVFS
jgi:hypothetical protein